MVVPKYSKINTLWMRDEKGKIMEGQYSRPEFQYLWKNDWEFHEKVDGTNIRVIWDGGKVEFRGKSDEASIPPFLLKRLEERFPLQKFLDRKHFPCILFGEGYGQKIQNGGEYLPNDHDFILFDIVGFKDFLYKPSLDVNLICDDLGIVRVPQVFIGPLEKAVEMVRKGFPSLINGGARMAEGLVGRPMTPLYGHDGERIIVKLKHRDFL